MFQRALSGLSKNIYYISKSDGPKGRENPAFRSVFTSAFPVSEGKIHEVIDG